MSVNNFEKYDLQKMEEAKQELKKIYEYYYGAPGMSKKLKKLETIINKIEKLQKND